MLVTHALLAPHLPTLPVDEHRGHRTPMLEALAERGRRLAAEAPSILVVLSARWDSDGPFWVVGSRGNGTVAGYGGFGVEVRYDCPGHPALARALVEAGDRAGVRVGATQRGVDSGVTVPLHFLCPRAIVPVVPLSLARRPATECRSWGAVIRSILQARPERIAFIVGGLLSHALHAWNLGREVPEARAFDAHALRALGAGAWEDLRGDDPALVERAQPEADLRHLEVLRGFLGENVQGQLLCYEEDHGMGAALVDFEIREREPATRRPG